MDDFYSDMSMSGAFDSMDTPQNIPEIASQFQQQTSNMGF